jgi:hypothetical protein
VADFFMPPLLNEQPSATKKSGRKQKEYLPPEEADSMLDELGKSAWGAVDVAGRILDYPGAIARGVLAGDPASGFSWDWDRRVSGEELLESYGILNKDDNPYARAGAGFAAEVALDPSAWFTFGASALGKAGKAAKAAGILDSAPLAAQKRMGQDVTKTLAGSMADNAFTALEKQGIARSDDMYRMRPLVGPRYSQATTTLEETIKSSKDPIRAMDDVVKYLNKYGINYDDIKHEKLGGAVGFGFMSPWATFTPPGSLKALDALDAVGQATKWSAPMRYAASFVDQRVAGQTGAADQLSAMRNFEMRKSAERVGRQKAVDHALTLKDIEVTPQAAAILGSDTLLSPQGNDFLTRIFENVPTKQDLQLKSLLPGVDRAYQSWDDIRKFNVDEARKLGMRINPYGDRFGVLYSPRSGTEFDFEDFQQGISRSLFSTSSAEGYSRRLHLITPGGTADLREISMLPNVRTHAKSGIDSPLANKQLGEEIAQFLNTKHGYDAITNEQGEAIARTMMRLNKDLPADIPAFAQHPLNAQARNIVNQEMARSNAKFIYESLADAAIDAEANTLAGGRFRPLNTALNDIAGKTGLRVSGGEAAGSVQRNVIERIAAKRGVSPDSIDLSKIAIPEAVHNRLTKLQDFYSQPAALDEVGNLWNRFTSITKGFLLAWPSRHLRDAYSNVFSIFLETGSAPDTLAGIQLAKKIVAGGFDEVAGEIAKLPQYQGIANRDALRQAFMRDVGGEGVLTTLSTSDLLTTTRAGDLDQLVPGSTPMRRSDFFWKDLMPDGSRNPLQMAKDFATIRNVTDKYKTLNPLLNASQRYGDWNDSVGRLGGYLALLRQGVSPSEAARRMRDALVDYSSLTPVERHTIRNVFIWWSYSSRIGKYAVQSLYNNPGGRYAQTIRGMNTLQRSDEKHYVPEALRQQLGIRIGQGDPVSDIVRRILAIPEDSQTDTYLKDIDLPGIDVLSLLSPGDLRGTIGNVANQMHPAIRTFAELATNQDLFSKRPLDEAVAPIDRLWMRMSGSQTGVNPTLKAVINNIPGPQRIIGLAGGLSDQRIPWDQRWRKQAINATLGVKLQDVDPNYWIAEARRKNAERMKGYAKKGSFFFLPKDQRENVPEHIKKAFALEQELARRQKLLNKEKEKQ